MPQMNRNIHLKCMKNLADDFYASIDSRFIYCWNYIEKF